MCFEERGRHSAEVVEGDRVLKDDERSTGQPVTSGRPEWYHYHRDLDSGTWSWDGHMACSRARRCPKASKGCPPSQKFTLDSGTSYERTGSVHVPGS